MALSCRLCRTPLHADHGCVVCDEWRVNLSVDDEDDGDRPSLAAVSSEMVAALRNALRNTTEKLRRNALDAGATVTLLKVGNTLSKVLESARKLQDDGLSAVKAMSFMERAELFLGWYGALPPAYRTQVRDSMAKFEADARTKLPSAPAQKALHA